MHQPGERWMYHSAFDILPALISRASGMRFEDFLRKRIFEPLGMKDTSFTVPKSKLHRLATCYNVDSKTGKLVPYDGKGGSPQASVFPGGGSGLAATVDDYLAFGQMMLNGGRHGTQRILSRPTIELMTADQVTPEQKKLSTFLPGFWETRGWGFGVSMFTRREDISSVPGRYGWDGGFGTSWSSDPREDMVGILMIQRFGPPSAVGIYGDFWTLAYQAIDD
jgi:CubicO group peptidase (beta-lactamase class C family)